MSSHTYVRFKTKRYRKERIKASGAVRSVGTMSFKIFVVLIILGIVSLVVSQETINQDRRCVPGKTHFDGCNHCTCHPNGEMSCTLMLCETSYPLPADFWEKE